MTIVHRLRRGRRLRIGCGLIWWLIWRLIGRIGLVGRASRPISPGALPLAFVALAVVLVRALARVLPLIPSIVLGAVVILPGIWRLWRLWGLWGERRLRALIIRLMSPSVLPSMVRCHLVRPSLSSSAMLPGSSRPNPRPHRLIHNITLLGIDRVTIAQTVPPSWRPSGILNDSRRAPEYYNDGATSWSPFPGSLLAVLSQLSASSQSAAGVWRRFTVLCLCGAIRGMFAVQVYSIPPSLSMNMTRVALVIHQILSAADITSQPIVLLIGPNL